MRPNHNCTDEALHTAYTAREAQHLGIGIKGYTLFKTHRRRGGGGGFKGEVLLSQIPPYLSNIICCLKVLQLRHGVVTQCLVQGPVSKLVAQVHAGTLPHQQLQQRGTVITSTPPQILCSYIFMKTYKHYGPW